MQGIAFYSDQNRQSDFYLLFVSELTIPNSESIQEPIDSMYFTTTNHPIYITFDRIPILCQLINTRPIHSEYANATHRLFPRLF
jgi:hypothetical protein